MSVVDGPAYNHYVQQDIGWTDGERLFSLSVTPQGLVTFGLENQLGGMDTLSLSIPHVVGQIRTIWLTPYTEESNSTATIQLDTFNGSPVSSGTPFASNTNTEGTSLEIYGFSPSSTISMTGRIHDSSNVNSNRTTDFTIDGYSTPHVPEPASALLLAVGIVAAWSRRTRKGT